MLKRTLFQKFAMVFGFSFLYLPILLIVIFSFNESKLVTVWGGFSFKWYGELFRDFDMLNAAWLSLKVGFISATLATILGTVAGLIMARFGPFKGRAFLAAMMSTPMVMPEVILGISFLLMFVAMEKLLGWPGDRGFLTLIIAHTTFTLAYVSVIVQSRLADMDPSIDEAAQDLGARPLKIFFWITLPMIVPALASGWLLAFSLSVDDVVISQFVTGPGYTTLPLRVFASVKLGIDPKINALGTLIIALVGTGALLSGISMMRRSKKTK